VFYDNNFLAHPTIDDLLLELSQFRLPGGQRLRCECQSGFDLNLLTLDRARLLKLAGFHSMRIAWDGEYKDWPRVKNAILTLRCAGFRNDDIFVFMIFNYKQSYEEMRLKLDSCRRWGIRVIDCRYRPLSLTKDGYVPGPKRQGEGAYYVHAGWTDMQVRRFRRAVRRQNIAILLDLPNGRYIPGCEKRFIAQQ